MLNFLMVSVGFCHKYVTLQNLVECELFWIIFLHPFSR